ncbi:MAG: cytochrome-c oxidase, cbb3-type subunit III, partial [Proteobacteria bacterium]|nr:cytochrome-c oxidase, cbb3-type subunit III [Pseudomonadota bacterium]
RREIDPVTGYDTTGHDWNGIKELNTPLPRLVIWALVLAFAYSVIAWILLPAWPLGGSYTRGLWKLDQGQEAEAGYRSLATERQGWLKRFANPDFAALRTDKALMQEAMPAARRLFDDNCAACHGTEGQGGPGYPVLSDHSWLWSGDPKEIAVTIRHGINAADSETRVAEMPAFDWIKPADRTALALYVSKLRGGGVHAGGSAAALFAENCAACHGEGGKGGLDLGAPSLTDRAVLYGQDPDSVEQTLKHGRRGMMPAWAGRLSDTDINLLALYVAGLGDKAGKP